MHPLNSEYNLTPISSEELQIRPAKTHQPTSHSNQHNTIVGGTIIIHLQAPSRFSLLFNGELSDVCELIKWWQLCLPELLPTILSSSSPLHCVSLISTLCIIGFQNASTFSNTAPIQFLGLFIYYCHYSFIWILLSKISKTQNAITNDR